MKLVFVISALVLVLGVAAIDINEKTTVPYIKLGLERLLGYMKQNNRKFNINGAIMALISREFFRDILRTDKIGSKNETKFYLEGTEVLIKDSMSYLKKRGLDLTSINLMYQHEVWKCSIIYKNGQLDNEIIYLPDVNILNRNGFDQSDSVGCLMDILSIKPGEKGCPSISGNCREKYIKSTALGSYFDNVLKVYMMTISLKKLCLTEKDFDNKMKYLCSNIHQELTTLAHIQKLYHDIDMFLVSVVLCGRLGFNEYFKAQWLTGVLEAQRVSGCFGTGVKKTSTMDVWDDDCNDFSTGHGLAFLSLYYNRALKNGSNF